jgi:chromate transporter
MSTQEKNSFSLIELLKYFIYLGSCCFGGPIALVGHMQKDLVEKKNWYSAEEFQNALAFSKLTPGPFAVQLGMYLGYLRFKITGATLVLLAFVIPPSFIVLVISFFYVRYKGLSWLEAFLYGMSPAAISIIFKAAINLSKLSIQKDKMLWLLFFIVFLISIFSKTELIVLIIIIGIIYMLFNKKTLNSFSLLPINGLNINLVNPVLVKLFIYFFSAGLLVFGSGLAIVPFLHEGVVEKYQWITEKEFIDAVSIGMVTPGPVLVTVTFIGYLIKGVTGAIISTIAVFLPVYFFVIFLSPIYNKFSKNKDVQSFITGVTACICGAIFASCFTLANKVIIDPQTFLIFLISAFCLTKFKLIPEPVIILVAGVLGIILRPN